MSTMTHADATALDLAAHLRETHGWTILPSEETDLTTLEAMHIIAAEQGPCDPQPAPAWEWADVERPARHALSALLCDGLDDAEAIFWAVELAETAVERMITILRSTR